MNDDELLVENEHDAWYFDVCYSDFDIPEGSIEYDFSNFGFPCVHIQ